MIGIGTWMICLVLLEEKMSPCVYVGNKVKYTKNALRIKGVLMAGTFTPASRLSKS